MTILQRLLWSVSATVVLLVIAAPVARAQCPQSRWFTSLGSPGPGSSRVVVDVAGSTSEGPSPPLGVVGRFWAASNAFNGNNFDGFCPAVSGPGEWWVVPPGPGPGEGYRALDGIIGTPDCATSGCPWPDDLVVVVEDTTPDQADAFLLVMRTYANPIPPHIPAWDFRAVWPPGPGSTNTLPFARFPKPDITSMQVTGPDLIIDFQAEDLAQNFWGVNGSPPTPLPASAAMKRYDVYAFHGPADPGREVGNWTPIHQVPYADAPANVFSLAVPCGDPTTDIYLALGVTFDGGGGIEIASTYVGESVQLSCDPDPEEPDSISALIGGASLEDVVLSWNQSSPTDTAHFRILRAGEVGGPYSVWHDTSSDPDPLATTWTDVGAAGDDLSYFYKVEAVDDLGIGTSSPELIAAKISYDLVLEWNLASFPLIQLDESVAEVMKTLDHGAVQYWDATDPVDPWKTYNPHVPPPLNDLHYLTHKMGFWVYIEGPDQSWAVAGTVPGATSFTMETDWNMIGYPRLPENPADQQTAGEFRNQIEVQNPGVHVLEMEVGEPGAQNDLRPLLNHELMEHGLGYWVQLDAPAVLTNISIEPPVSIYSSDIFVIPSLGATGADGILGATVHNVEDSPSSPLDVSFYEGETLIDGAHIESIPAGSSSTVTVAWTPVVGAVIRVVVDSNSNNSDGYLTEAYRTWMSNEIPLVTCNDTTTGNDLGQCSAAIDCESVADCVDPEGGGTAVTCDPPGAYPIGATSVTFRCNDGVDITTEFCSVTVEDQEPPEVTVSLVPVTLWPPNHRMVDIEALVEAIDLCSATSVVLTSVTSNEADNGEGDGDTVNDIRDAAEGTADYQFKLRAERAGEGDGRIYTAVYTAEDASGNPTAEADIAVVPHDQDGVTEPIQLLLEQNENGTLVSWGEVPGVESYDVIRGLLGNIAETDELINLGAVTCIENDSADGTTAGWEDPLVPSSGEGFFYLVEYFDGTGCGYGTESADLSREPGPGDCE